jgi:exopolyphosphatase/pppGpp-phosphohydrolase
MMNSAMSSHLLLDLGSRSAKAYRKDTTWVEDRQVTWSLLENDRGESEIFRDLQSLVSSYQGRSKISAIGTEAMRRNPKLAAVISNACKQLGIAYRTLSHKEEAELILKAIPDTAGRDLINVGGGSIQIISSQTAEMHLLCFGISDLNKHFALNEAPCVRQIETCVAWIESQLPKLSSSFIYTGGEEKYLRHLGLQLPGGLCNREVFEDLASKMAELSVAELEALSPHDPKWMRGAVASNCIVRALLRRSAAKNFVPSDLNIAHGLMDAALIGV